MWRWDAYTTNLVAVILLIIALFLLLILCVLSVFFCRKRRSDWPGESSVLAPPFNDSSCYNDAFDYAATSARRIEERRIAREMALSHEVPRADLSLKKMDRSVGAALAVEQLMRDSYVFDTRLMPRPHGDVQVIAAKRDYL